MSIKRSIIYFLVAGNILTAGVIGFLLTTNAQAKSTYQTGITIPYMGSLKDDSGQPVSDGNYDFVLALYTTENGGKPAWSETQSGIMVQGGVFTILLGNKTPLSKELLTNKVRWLEVSVRGPGESSFTMLSPRQELSTTSIANTTPQGGGGLSCAHTHWGETWSGSGVGLHLISSNDTPLWAESTGGWAGVDGRNTTNNGVYGFSNSAIGVLGESNSGYGVKGVSKGTSGAIGVYGEANNATCTQSSCIGVNGFSSKGSAIYAVTESGVGVLAYASGNGIPLAVENSSTGTGNLIEAIKYGTPPDRKFYVSNSGDVYADGSYHSYGADLAEMLPAVEELEPGDVLVIGLDGLLTRSSIAYQPTVVGVYSSNPGFIGGSNDDSDQTGKIPLVVIGVVPVKASAENGTIQPGDLLVTSSIPGYAMKADPNQAVGTVIGKALETLESGTGMIQMLVMLQ